MSHIKNIEIKNFKSIRHAKIEDCRRVNVFIGYPNVGKSNILEAMSLFSIDSTHKNAKDFIRLEKSTGFFYNGDVKKSSQVIFNQNTRARASYTKDGIDIFFESDRKAKGFSQIDEELEEEKKRYTLGLGGTKQGSLLHERGSFFIKELNKEITRCNGRVDLLIFKEVGEDIVNAKIENRISILKYEYKRDVQHSDGNALQLKYPFGENLFEIISSTEELKDAITEIFKTYNLEFLYDSDTQSYKILKRLEKGIFTIAYSMVADTIQRLIFHKAAMSSNENAVLLFEEPEAHMFPPYISKFTADVMYDNNDNQFFITTHSPFVLNDFMENLKKEEYSIYTVGYKMETGETVVRRMTDEEIHEIYQYGVDVFFNLENYLQHEQQ
jgi:AAA15 family ATPase/GTPase